MTTVKIAEITDCFRCPHYSPGFLSEPGECDYFKEAYKWFTPRQGIGIPEWCPLPDKAEKL